MFSWLNRDASKKKEPEVFATVTDGLRKLYKTKLLPLEEFYRFHDFHSPALDDPDFDAKPMILLVGQYSTGKTTFIKYLLEQDFPGCRIGPEPTTDRFIAVMHGETEGVIPGNALVVDPKKQFRPLSRFGNAFLNRFQCSTLPNPVLESISIIDTPGILSGEKQRTDRGYNFAEVVEWLAERVDRIILLFDAHKLDISDEFRRVIECMRGHHSLCKFVRIFGATLGRKLFWPIGHNEYSDEFLEELLRGLGYDDKVRIVLNKSDMIDNQQLMRVYGALMWSLGKVFNTPEVSRVYIGSFWNNPLQFDSCRKLFELEEQDLFHDLQSLPRHGALRKLNDLIKRARLAKVHAYIMHQLRKDMPSMFGKDSRKKELIQNLPEIFGAIQREHQISPGDFPDIRRMQEQLQHHDFTKFNVLKPKLLETVDLMLSEDIARLMNMIPNEERVRDDENTGTVHGGAFHEVVESPFGVGKLEGADKGRGDEEWIVGRDRYKYDEVFRNLNPINGKITGAAAKAELVKSKLPNNILGKIWKLSDIDHDGMLDADEFALAMHLVGLKVEGHEIPSILPEHLIPPSKQGINGNI